MSKVMRAWLAAAVLLAAGCDDTQAPGETDLLEEEIAGIAGTLAAGDVLAMQGQGMPGFGTPGMLFPPLLNGMPPCGGATPCPEVRHEGLAHTRTITFLDAEGGVQAAYDSLTTASIRFQLDVNGTLAREYCTAEVARTHDLVLSGLAGAELQASWNGTGAGSMVRTCTSDGVERTLDVHTATRVQDVVIPRGPQLPWPLSGTITQAHRAVRETSTGTVTVERTAVITFDGSRYAQLTIGDRTWTLDLAQRGLPMPDRHRRRTGM